MIGISFFITNCQKENFEPVNLTEIEKSNYLSNYISGEKIPEIINLINPKYSSSKTNSSKLTMISSAFGEISLENILEVIDTLGNKNYSFILTPKTPKQNSIFNLVIKSSNQTTQMAIFEYRMAPSFAQDYYKGLKTFKNFTGSIFKFPYLPSSNLFSKSSGTCIQNIDEVINCDQIDVSNGNVLSSPSGGGDTQGTTSISDTYTYTGADGGNVVHNYGGPSTGGSGGSIELICVKSPRDFDCDWVLVITPNDHLNRKSNPKNKISETNCCDNTSVDGGVGVNITKCIPGFVKDANDNCVPISLPCNNIQKQLINTKYKEKVVELKGKTHLKYETGYAEDKEGNITPLPLKEGGHSLDLTKINKSNTNGYIHSHQNDIYTGVIVDGQEKIIKPIRMFSPEDVIQFLVLAKRTPVSMIPLEEVYCTMISSSGNYTLKFTGNIDHIVGLKSAEVYDEIYKNYFKDYLNKEKAFLLFLKNEIGINGIELYKFNVDGKIQLKTVDGDNKVQTSECII